jgi:hypothetical protein
MVGRKFSIAGFVRESILRILEPRENRFDSGAKACEPARVLRPSQEEGRNFFSYSRPGIGIILGPEYCPAEFMISACGLFHFKKDRRDYSIKPEDYATKPLFTAATDNRLLNDFYMYVLQVF